MPVKPKILIVDDNELNIKLCSAILKMEYEFLIAKSAEEGLDIARRTVPDLILMDIQLPGMDGLTATRQIRADDGLKAIPVIALTSFAMVGDREKALAAGCDEYLTKPIDVRGLRTTVARFLEGPRTALSDTPSGRTPEIRKADVTLN